MKKACLFWAVCAVLGVSIAMGQEGALVPNRLAEARVGEWASYRLPDGYIQKLTVVKRSGDGPEAMVTVRVENIYNGETVNVHETTQEAGEPETAPRIPEGAGVTVSVRNETAVVKGSKHDVAVVQIDRVFEDDDDSRVEWWIARNIPVFGIVKKVEDGVTKWEIEDWGE